MSIGARIRQLRTRNNLSGEKFGELCGVTKGAISQWESDLVKPPTDKLLELRQKLNFSFDWLLGGEPPNKQVDPRIAHVVEVMEALPTYAVDAGVKEIDTLAELVSNLPSSPSTGTDG